MLTVTQSQIDQWLVLLWWPFLRIMGVLLADPVYSSRRIPPQVRIGLALAITVLVAPSLTPPADISLASPIGLLVAARELLIGLSIGFVARVLFSAMEMAGHLAGLQMGLGFATFYDPQHSTNVPIMAQLFSLFTLLVFLAFNGHLIMLRVLIDSFTLLPMGNGPFNVEGFRLLAVYGEVIFRAGVLLSLPVLGALLITNLTIGVMSKASPQLNVFAVGFPLTLGIGFAALYFTLPFMIPGLDALIADLTRFVARVVQTFAR